MKSDFGITVCTPTYNRAYTLKKLYESLVNQTNKEFEWLIIDDGSNDNTQELVKSFIKESKIEIRYYYKENGGKSSAFNKGVEYANKNLFFCVDSDDYLADNCIELFNNINMEIKNKDDVVGIIAFRENVTTKNNYPKKIEKKYIALSELYAKLKYKGETALAYKTSLLKQNPFPIIKGNKFITESWLYDRLDKIGKSYFLQEKVYFCQYLDDGYTKNDSDILKKNVNSFLLFSEQRMDIGLYFKTRLKGAVYYNVCNFVKKTSLTKHVFHKHFFMIVGTLIPSYIYYMKKFKK